MLKYVREVKLRKIFGAFRKVVVEESRMEGEIV